MFSRVFFFLLVVALATAGLGDPLPTYGPYIVTPCNGAGQPTCNVQFALNPQPVSGLTNALFQSFFGSFGFTGASTGTYTWSVTDVNSSGVAIGQVRDVNILIDTGFVFDQGSLICCTADQLRFRDINDNGFVVGNFSTGTGFDAFVAYCCGGLNDGQNRIGVTFVPPIYNHAFSFGTFLGIDDSERILATSFAFSQKYELDPTPEPRSLLLLTTVLGSTVFVIQRWMSSRRV